jgi:5'-deoxynucleotidase YfbR-like HD superfamily hydrolase
MALDPHDLGKIEQLVLDILTIERNHRIPGTDRRENVVEHSFSVAMLCWKIFDVTHPPLDIVKIFKYALVHDFSERGYKFDVNTYATKEERATKKDKEALELKKITSEFEDFKDFTLVLNNYEKSTDAEALFVWSVDKMQSIILGEIDGWRPYSAYGVTYDQFCKKGEEFLDTCSPYVKDIFTKVLEQAKKTYYDQPDR